MRQYAFEKEHEALWQEFDELLVDLNQRKHLKEKLNHYELPALYRRICHHYAVAQQRHYSPHLINALHRRVLKGHQLLYSYKTSWLWRMLSFIWIVFPQQIRRHWKHFWLATALFYVPGVSVGLACYYDAEMIYQLLPDTSVADMEYMYDPSNEHIGRKAERQADTDFKMFGYYILNNISIGFRTYALGILFGLGTLFIIIYNGLIIGAVAGHLTQLGFTETFWSFVSGHGSFELTAICICGAAGLRLAQPLISPGRLKRIDALKVAGKDSIQMVIGAALMLLIAAFIEAFWSSSSVVTNTVKYSVAGGLWLIVILYLWRAGRNHDLIISKQDAD